MTISFLLTTSSSCYSDLTRQSAFISVGRPKHSFRDIGCNCLFRAAVTASEHFTMEHMHASHFSFPWACAFEGSAFCTFQLALSLQAGVAVQAECRHFTLDFPKPNLSHLPLLHNLILLISVSTIIEGRHNCGDSWPRAAALRGSILDKRCVEKKKKEAFREWIGLKTAATGKKGVTWRLSWQLAERYVHKLLAEPTISVSTCLSPHAAGSSILLVSAYLTFNILHRAPTFPKVCSRKGLAV